jgi:hypothetical protein
LVTVFAIFTPFQENFPTKKPLASGEGHQPFGASGISLQWEHNDSEKSYMH